MNITASYELTVVIPIFSQEESLPELFSALEKYKNKSTHRFCVLFVDDASTDKSLTLIRDHCAKVQDAFYISLLRRNGISGALKAGLLHTFSENVGYLDPEIKLDPLQFEKLFAKLPDAGMVCGERDFSKNRSLRHYVAKIASLIRRSITHDGLKDALSPVKLAKTELLKKLPWFSGMHYLMPALMILSGNRVNSVIIESYGRRTSMRRHSSLCELLALLCDLLIFMWMRCRYIDPAVGEGNLKQK
ncbi:MAG: glycosyltransferase family 2 protein [Succinatimonas sp.]|nr:glycosyltransferase family 2 protein [Succinatimonas sp.]